MRYGAIGRVCIHSCIRIMIRVYMHRICQKKKTKKKLGFAGVYIIFLISAQNTDCRTSLEPPRRGCSNESHNLLFEQKCEKMSDFFFFLPER